MDAVLVEAIGNNLSKKIDKYIQLRGMKGFAAYQEAAYLLRQEMYQSTPQKDVDWLIYHRSNGEL